MLQILIENSLRDSSRLSSPSIQKQIYAWEKRGLTILSSKISSVNFNAFCFRLCNVYVKQTIHHELLFMIQKEQAKFLFTQKVNCSYI